VLSSFVCRVAAALLVDCRSACGNGLLRQLQQELGMAVVCISATATSPSPKTPPRDTRYIHKLFEGVPSRRSCSASASRWHTGSHHPFRQRLRLVPKGRVVVLGLVTTKSGSLEAKDAIKRRIDEAAKFVDIGAAALGHDQLVVGKAKRIGLGSNQVDHIAGSIA